MPTAERLADVIDMGSYRERRAAAWASLRPLYEASIEISLARHEEALIASGEKVIVDPEAVRQPARSVPIIPQPSPFEAAIGSRPPRKMSPARHLVGKTCGTGGTYVSSPLRITCDRCRRRAAEEILVRRRAGEPPRWPREVEEKIVGWFRRNRRITTRRAS